MERFSMDMFKEFFEAVLKLKSVEDCEKFFEDVCTIKELMDMKQRLEVASLLTEGKNYQEVCKVTGASTATISRVNKCLMYGKGGYSLVLDSKTEKVDK
jgi:TrpR-related protein YerC/YecD